MVAVKVRTEEGQKTDIRSERVAVTMPAGSLEIDCPDTDTILYACSDPP
jgi:hypothetical protein